jgi:hypothetical protein
MARGGHGLPKVPHGPAMPNPSMPCRRTTLETTVSCNAVSGVAWPQGGRPVAVSFPFRHPTPYAYDGLGFDERHSKYFAQIEKNNNVTDKQNLRKSDAVDLEAVTKFHMRLIRQRRVPRLGRPCQEITLLINSN